MIPADVMEKHTRLVEHDISRCGICSQRLHLVGSWFQERISDSVQTWCTKQWTRSGENQGLKDESFSCWLAGTAMLVEVLSLDRTSKRFGDFLAAVRARENCHRGVRQIEFSDALFILVNLDVALENLLDAFCSRFGLGRYQVQLRLGDIDGEDALPHRSVRELEAVLGRHLGGPVLGPPSRVTGPREPEVVGVWGLASPPPLHGFPGVSP